jgi:hypothetical protein
MPPNRIREFAALLLLLLVESWLFSQSFDKFFNLDSLYYLIHYPRSFDDLICIFSAPDPALQFRPISVAVMGLLVPILGREPGPYHWVPLILHLVNTLLFYRFARRLMPGGPSAFAAAAFWGLHSVAGWITYDITCISDLLLAGFLLASLILALDGRAMNSRLRLAGSLVLFACALLTKEAATTFPLAVLLTLILADLGSTETAFSASALWKSFRRAIPLTSIYLVLALLHAGLLIHWLRSGLLYAQGSSAAYDINLWANLAAKTKYWYWALNLPDALQIPRANSLRILVLILIGTVLLLWLLDVMARRAKLAPVEWAGLIWVVGLNLPAFMLSGRLSKWYLYVPLFGLALAFGSLPGRLQVRLRRLGDTAASTAIVLVLLLPFLFSSMVQTRSYLISSDAAYSSQIVESCLRGFQEANPTLPRAVTLFWLPFPAFEKNVADLLKAPPVGEGQLFELYYPGTEVHMLFADKGDRLPEDYSRRADFRILQYMLGHLNDVTEYYKGRRCDSSSRRVIERLEDVKASVSRDEFYPSYDSFLTPGGTPVFFPTPQKDVLTQIGGSTVVVSLDAIETGTTLRSEVSWMFDGGDGGWAELSVRAPGRESVLFREYLHPSRRSGALCWKELNVDLGPFAGQRAEMVLRCYNDPGKTTVADWLNWRDIVLDYRKDAAALAPRSSPPDSCNR